MKLIHASLLGDLPRVNKHVVCMWGEFGSVSVHVAQKGPLLVPRC